MCVKDRDECFKGCNSTVIAIEAIFLLMFFSFWVQFRNVFSQYVSVGGNKKKNLEDFLFYILVDKTHKQGPIAFNGR